MLSSFAATIVSTVNRYLHFRKIKTRMTLRQKALNELDSTITRPRLDAGVWLVHYGSKGHNKELEGVGRKVVGV